MIIISQIKNCDLWSDVYFDGKKCKIITFLGKIVWHFTYM